MIVAFAVVSAALAWLSWRMLSGAVQAWRGGPPMSQRWTSSLLDRESRAGFDRSGLALGLAWGLLAVFLAGIALASLLHAQGKVVGGMLSAIAVGMFAIMGLAGTIIEFNRPKFLVPPRFRGDLGAMAAHRQRRRSSRT